MGMLDKLKFWKKEPEEFDMGKFPSLEQGPGLGAPTEMGGMAPPSQGLTEMPDGMSSGRMPGEMNADARMGAGRMPGEMPGMEEIGPAPPAPFPGMMSEGGRGRGQMPAPSSFAPAPVMQSASQGYDVSRDMQVVNAKLDTLKALLDSVNAKLDRMEQKQPKEEEAIPLSVRRWR